MQDGAKDKTLTDNFSFKRPNKANCAKPPDLMRDAMQHHRAVSGIHLRKCYMARS